MHYFFKANLSIARIREKTRTADLSDLTSPFDEGRFPSEMTESDETQTPPHKHWAVSEIAHRVLEEGLSDGDEVPWEYCEAILGPEGVMAIWQALLTEPTDKLYIRSGLLNNWFARPLWVRSDGDVANRRLSLNPRSGIDFDVDADVADMGEALKRIEHRELAITESRDSQGNQILGVNKMETPEGFLIDLVDVDNSRDLLIAAEGELKSLLSIPDGILGAKFESYRERIKAYLTERRVEYRDVIKALSAFEFNALALEMSLDADEKPVVKLIDPIDYLSNTVLRSIIRRRQGDITRTHMAEAEIYIPITPNEDSVFSLLLEGLNYRHELKKQNPEMYWRLPKVDFDVTKYYLDTIGRYAKTMSQYNLSLRFPGNPYGKYLEYARLLVEDPFFPTEELNLWFKTDIQKKFAKSLALDPLSSMRSFVELLPYAATLFGDAGQFLEPVLVGTDHEYYRAASNLLGIINKAFVRYSESAVRRFIDPQGFQDHEYSIHTYNNPPKSVSEIFGVVAWVYEKFGIMSLNKFIECVDKNWEIDGEYRGFQMEVSSHEIRSVVERIEQDGTLRHIDPDDYRVNFS